MGLALARICVSLEISNKDNFPAIGLIFFTYSLHWRIALKFYFRYIIIIMKRIDLVPLIVGLQTYLSSSTFETSITHIKQNLTFIIKLYLATFYTSKKIINLMISIAIVTSYTQCTQYKYRLRGCQENYEVEANFSLLRLTCMKLDH